MRRARGSFAPGSGPWSGKLAFSFTGSSVDFWQPATELTKARIVAKCKIVCALARDAPRRVWSVTMSELAIIGGLVLQVSLLQAAGLSPTVVWVAIAVFVGFVIWKAAAGRGGDRRAVDVELRPFHLAIAVDDLAAAEKFYAGRLGCAIGRRSERWIDFDFYGHQLTAHLVEGDTSPLAANAVDGDEVPPRHFGIILSWAGWEALSETLKGQRIEFLLEPKVRFEGKPGEQATFFIRDPAGNALEFKAFPNDEPAVPPN